MTRYKVSETLLCEGSPKLVLDVNGGRIFIRGWDSDAVKFEAVGERKPDWQVAGGRFELAVGGECAVTIYMPRQGDVYVDGTELEIDAAGVRGLGSFDSTGGRIRVENWHGQIEVDTATASVSLAHVQGPVEIDTSDGNVELSACQGNITVDTGAGDVVVNDCSGALVADTGRGSVSLRQFRGPVSIDTGSGSVALRDVSGRNVHVDANGPVFADLPGGSPGQWNLNAGSNQVEITVPGNISARFEFTASELDVDALDLEQWESDGDRMRGIAGGGSGRVRVAGRRIVAHPVVARTLDAEHPPGSPQEESLKILTMLEQGAITTAEAEALLDALTGGERDE